MSKHVTGPLVHEDSLKWPVMLDGGRDVDFHITRIQWRAHSRQGISHVTIEQYKIQTMRFKLCIVYLYQLSNHIDDSTSALVEKISKPPKSMELKMDENLVQEKEEEETTKTTSTAVFRVTQCPSSNQITQLKLK